MIRNLKQTKPWLVTAQRQLILGILREAGAHIDAKEVYRRASERDPEISIATVYRSLHLFKEMGLIDEIRLGQVRCCYEVKRSGEHHHLVCRDCGRIIDVESPLIQQLVMEVQQKNKFHVTRAELCLEGYCEECEERQK
jgi:Fur family ferric uptake transcriptional regulator